MQFRKRFILLSISLFIFLIIIAGLIFTLTQNKRNFPTPPFAKVIQVIDGDTFKINTGEKVRLVGIDTPELHHPKKPVQCFGREAMLKTKELVEGKVIRLEKDISEKDRYGRLLRFVYIPMLSPTPEIFINAYLVQEGYARVATFPPDVSKSDTFVQLAREAFINNKGLWKSCK